MLYHTTVAFIFTLFLIQISRALPQACGDHISPASDSVQHCFPCGDAPHALSSVQPPICDPQYDNPKGSMHTVACAHPLEKRYPLFDDIPSFPYIGGVFDVTPDPPMCAECWNLTTKEGAHIYVTAIDRAPVPLGFTMSVAACKALNIRGPGELTMVEKVPRNFCKLPPNNFS